MNIPPKGPQAARLRQRKFQLLRRIPIPPDLLPGSLSLTHSRCGQPTCHCARDEKGHPVWSFTLMAGSKKRVERIPSEWVEEVQHLVEARREFQRSRGRGFCRQRPTAGFVAEAGGPVKGPAPHRLRRYMAKCLGLKGYLRSPGYGRSQPHLSATALRWALFMGALLRRSAFAAIEALLRSRARRALEFSPSFGDDALSYFTERLDLAVTRQATLIAVRQAKRHKAFDDNRFIGLALNGTSAGRSREKVCDLPS